MRCSRFAAHRREFERGYKRPHQSGKIGNRSTLHYSEFVAPKLDILEQAFREGFGVRVAAERAGCSSMTASRYRRVFLDLADLRCPCGRPAVHQGPCLWRLGRSLHRASDARWPFIFDDGLDPLVVAINEAVPRDLPEYVRQELCQDMAVAILEGRLNAENIGDDSWHALKHDVFRRYPTLYGPRSLDAEFNDGSHGTLKDFLGVPATQLVDLIEQESDADTDRGW